MLLLQVSSRCLLLLLVWLVYMTFQSISTSQPPENTSKDDVSFSTQIDEPITVLDLIKTSHFLTFHNMSKPNGARVGCRNVDDNWKTFFATTRLECINKCLRHQGCISVFATEILDDKGNYVKDVLKWMCSLCTNWWPPKLLMPGNYSYSISKELSQPKFPPSIDGTSNSVHMSAYYADFYASYHCINNMKTFHVPYNYTENSWIYPIPKLCQKVSVIMPTDLCDQITLDKVTIKVTVVHPIIAVQAVCDGVKWRHSKELVCDVQTGEWKDWSQAGLMCIPTMCYKNITNTESGRTRSIYGGSVKTTSSGKRCQKWVAQTPHQKNIMYLEDSMYIEDGGISNAKNYCRDPGSHGYLWCYTEDPGERWELCNTVPPCNEDMAYDD